MYLHEGRELISYLLCFLSLCCPSRDILFPIFISADPAYEGDWKVDNNNEAPVFGTEYETKDSVSYRELGHFSLILQ